MPIVFNAPTTKPTRRSLRLIVPEPEKHLWQQLRNRRLQNLKFRRQYSIGRYVVDFYCSALKLVIEIDGDSHYTDSAQAYDRERTLFLESYGCKVMRFTNADIVNNIDSVLERIAAHGTSPDAALRRRPLLSKER